MRADTNIKKTRLKSHMTQEQVAEEFKVSRQTVSNWETRKTSPDTANIMLGPTKRIVFFRVLR